MGFTFNDPECCIVLNFHLFTRDAGHIGKGWKFHVNSRYEGSNGPCSPFYLDNNPIGAVLYKARK
jgi:hypothetical protein